MNTSQSSSLSSGADARGATRVALLDAAERLFSLRGVEGTSVREIIKAAGANLGAINYHFGTKDRLALEVFARRLEPVNKERIARLDALETTVGSGRVRLEQIVEAMVRPAVEFEESGPACDALMRLVSRAFQEPNAELKKFVEQQFSEVARRFDAAILRAVPGLPPEELFWRVNFLFGTLHHGLEAWLRFEQIPTPSSYGSVRPDREGFILRVISFVAAGLAAPLPAQLASSASKARRPAAKRRLSKLQP